MIANNILSCSTTFGIYQAHDSPLVQTFRRERHPVATVILADLPADFIQRTGRLTLHIIFYKTKSHRYVMCDCAANDVFATNKGDAIVVMLNKSICSEALQHQR